MGYSYNEYYENFKDPDFEEKLNYYKGKGVSVDDNILKEFNNRGYEAAFATKQKEMLDDRIKSVKEEDQIGRMSEELRNMIPKIMKLRKEKEGLYPWEFDKINDVNMRLKGEKQAYYDKNRRRHKLKDDLKKTIEKSSGFTKQIDNCVNTREQIKNSVNKQINLLNQMQATMEVINGLDLNKAPLNNPQSLKMINELKNDLKEAQKIELHPNNPSKINDLTQKLNKCYLVLNPINVAKIGAKSKEKEIECDKYVLAKRSYGLNNYANPKATKNKDDDNER